MVTILYPIAFLVLGALLMAFAAHPTAKEIGKALFWAGAFALAFHLSTYPLRIG